MFVVVLIYSSLAWDILFFVSIGSCFGVVCPSDGGSRSNISAGVDGRLPSFAELHVANARLDVADWSSEIGDHTAEWEEGRF